MSLWPLVLIFLGIEVILSYVVNKEEKIRYDGAAIALVLLMAIFAMVMGGGEFIMEHSGGFRFLD